jgi:hypothetical protein
MPKTEGRRQWEKDLAELAAEAVAAVVVAAVVMAAVAGGAAATRPAIRSQV